MTTARPRQTILVCLGEAMIEFSPDGTGLWRQGFAGDTLNVAWALRALAPAHAQIRYLTRIGADAFSLRFRAFLAAAGIDDGLIGTDPARMMGLYTIETDASGERSFAYWRGQSAARGLADDPGLAGQLAGADLVYLSGITLAILSPAARAALLAVLAAKTFRIAFDPNIRPRLWEDMETARQTLTAAATLADIVLPTFDDEAMAFGDTEAAATLARYRALGVPEVVVKDGTRPTLGQGDGQLFAVPVAQPVAPVDTTGAGDAFNGAYLAARLAGGNIEAAIRQGQTVSRAVVAQRGALIPAQAIRDSL